MPVRTSYEPGTPSWVDLGTPDLEGSIAFYSGLFGWEAHVAPEPEAGGYTMFTSGGDNVAGMGPLMGEDQPPSWSTYVTVEDADATFATAIGAGATPLVEPMDVLDVGRMAIFMDPTGAAVSVWQPRSHIGADLVNEPVSLCWNELMTRDVSAAGSFYNSVFKWDMNTGTFPTPDGDEMTYTEIQLGGESVAGMMEMGDEYPDEVPAHWAIYFAVADVDETALSATDLGGSVLVPPMDIPPGRMAVLADPSGASFSIMKLNEEQA